MHSCGWHEWRTESPSSRYHPDDKQRHCEHVSMSYPANLHLLKSARLPLNTADELTSIRKYVTACSGRRHANQVTMHFMASSDQQQAVTDAVLHCAGSISQAHQAAMQLFTLSSSALLILCIVCCSNVLNRGANTQKSIPPGNLLINFALLALRHSSCLAQMHHGYLEA